jgi:hypothetical protein
MACEPLIEKGDTMPFLVPPIVAGALGVLGAVALAKFAAREWRRINAELHPDAAPAEAERPRLRRDPETGVFRPDEARRRH